MNVLRIETAARRSLIASDSSYHSWSPQQQELFRATMDENAQSRVDVVLLNELFGIRCSADEPRDVLDDLSPLELNQFNWAKLLTAGIGDDMIFLNEYMAEGTSLLDFETLYDYDYSDYLFQEKANKEEIKDYQGRDFYALRFPPWIRLIIDGHFYYSTFYSLAGYLIDQLDDKGSDIIQALVPHEYIEGKDNGKAEKGGSLLDFKLVAGGMEKQLEELISRWYRYMQLRWVELAESFNPAAPAVFVIDQNQGGDLNRNFIFNNEDSLKQVRWRHFLADCGQIETNFAEVVDLESREVSLAEIWLQKTYDDIIKNFDPKVIRLKKKMKIIVAPGAFDGILDKDEDE